MPAGPKRVLGSPAAFIPFIENRKDGPWVVDPDIKMQFKLPPGHDDYQVIRHPTTRGAYQLTTASGSVKPKNIDSLMAKEGAMPWWLGRDLAAVSSIPLIALFHAPLAMGLHQLKQELIKGYSLPKWTLIYTDIYICVCVFCYCLSIYFYTR